MSPLRSTALLLGCLVLGLVAPTAGSARALAGGPARAADGDTVDSVTMVADVPTGSGHDRTRLWRTGAGRITLGWNDDGGVTVYTSGGLSADETYEFTFTPPPGETLAEGEYVVPSGSERRDVPGISIDGVAGCGTGRFTVRQVDHESHRLWLTYESHCDDSRSTIFGEIRVNVAQESPGLLVAPRTVLWPPYYPGEAGRPVPVRLVNTSDLAQSYGDPRLSGDAGSFHVVSSDCDVLAPGDSCVVYVTTEPRAAGEADATLVVPRDDAAAVRVGLSGRGIPGHNQFLVRSSHGDTVGSGMDWVTDPLRQPLYAAMSTSPGGPTTIYVATDRFVARFWAPEGRSLDEPGSFRDHLDVQSTSTSNNRCYRGSVGRWRIQEVAVKKGALQRLRLDFEQRCTDTKLAPLFGAVAWRAKKPAADLPPRVHLEARLPTSGPEKRRVAIVRLEKGSGARRVEVLLRARGQDETNQVIGDLRLRAGETKRLPFKVSRSSILTVRSANSRPIVATVAYTS